MTTFEPWRPSSLLNAGVRECLRNALVPEITRMETWPLKYSKIIEIIVPFFGGKIIEIIEIIVPQKNNSKIIAPGFADAFCCEFLHRLHPT